jgi:hypothetical protein
VNLRHAAALALVTWFLLVPPLTNDGKVGAGQPLWKWLRVKSFDSAGECHPALFQVNTREPTVTEFEQAKIYAPKTGKTPPFSRSEMGKRMNVSLCGPRRRSAPEAMNLRHAAALALVGLPAIRIWGSSDFPLAAGGVRRPAPHSPQNFSAGSIAAPHLGHLAGNAEPHCVQNFRPSRLSAPHFAQCMAALPLKPYRFYGCYIMLGYARGWTVIVFPQPKGTRSCLWRIIDFA